MVVVSLISGMYTKEKTFGESIDVEEADSVDFRSSPSQKESQRTTIPFQPIAQEGKVSHLQSTNLVSDPNLTPDHPRAMNSCFYHWSARCYVYRMSQVQEIEWIYQQRL